MLTDKEQKELLEKIRNLKLPETSDKEIDLASLTIEGKIYYFDTVKQVPTFKILRNSIQTICELVAPIYPQISPLRYFELLFDRIDFNDIENVSSQEQGLNFSKLIFEVLNDGLKSDIDTQLLQFQKGIPKLSINEVIEVQKEIISKKDTLTNWVKGRIRNVSFTERYLNFCKSIKKEDTENKGFLSLNFTFLIYSFHDVIIDELLSSYETLSKSLTEITPLLQLTQPLPEPITEQESKTNRLKIELTKYGFYELPKVKALSEQNQNSLIEIICIQLMPYGIAMFDYLGFCDYLDSERGTKYKANIILSRIFNPKAKDGTTGRHYRNSLAKPKPRYNAQKYKQQVETDYEKLK